MQMSLLLDSTIYKHSTLGGGVSPVLNFSTNSTTPQPTLENSMLSHRRTGEREGTGGSGSGVGVWRFIKKMLWSTICPASVVIVTGVTSLTRGFPQTPQVKTSLRAETTL